MPDPSTSISSPALANGNVYFGGGDGNVYALDATSGSLKWKFQTGDVVHASPAIAKGMVYIGSWDSYFYALDAETGKEKWRFKTGEDKEIYNQVGIQSSAVVADGMVYFGCRDSNLYALDAATGEKRWAFNNRVMGDHLAGGGQWQALLRDFGFGHVLYRECEDRRAAVLAQIHLANVLVARICGKHAVHRVEPGGKLFALDATNQEVAWTFETDASKQNGPTYTKPDGTLKYEAVFSDDFYDDVVIGVNKMMMSVGAILSSPVVVDGVIYVGSADGNLYALK